MTYKFKEGDVVVEFPKQDGYDQDTGVVVAVDGSIYNRLGNIWVKWHSDGQVLHVGEECIRLVDCKQEMKEQ